jgi:hypothetical protein
MTSGIQHFDWQSLIAPFRPIVGSSRNQERAGTVPYTGYVRTSSITRTDKSLDEEWPS